MNTDLHGCTFSESCFNISRNLILPLLLLLHNNNNYNNNNNNNNNNEMLITITILFLLYACIFNDFFSSNQPVFLV
jgi:hypothetical protein